MMKRKPRSSSHSMKHLREVGVAGIIVASLAATPSTVAASSTTRAASRQAQQPSVITQRRANEGEAYQNRLSMLSAGLESDIFELEFKLSRLAQGHEI